MNPDDLDPTLEWGWRLVGRPPDTHFSANDTSPLVRDNANNELVTHAVLGPSSEDNNEEGDEEVDWAQILKYVVVAATAAAVGAGAVIVIRQRLDARAARKKARSETPESAVELHAQTEEIFTVEGEIETTPADVAAAITEQQNTMTSDEARMRVLEILAALRLIGVNLEALASSRITDTSAKLHLPADLDVAQLTDRLNQALEADTSPRDAADVAALLEVLGGGVTVDGEYKPLDGRKVRTALNLLRPNEHDQTRTFNSPARSVR